MIGLFVAALITVALTQVAFAQNQELIPERTSLDDQPPRMVSAFFGLDNDLPRRRLRSMPGLDGMPVTFSRRVEGPIETAAFTVVTRSGARHQPVSPPPVQLTKRLSGTPFCLSVSWAMSLMILPSKLR